MAVEKAFAIKAAPYEIYGALEREIDEARDAGGDFELVRRDPGRLIELRTKVGLVPCAITYELLPRDGHTEVVARLVALGWRAVLFRVMTFGLREQNYGVVLVHGLANLKASVERAARDDATR